MDNDEEDDDDDEDDDVFKRPRHLFHQHVQSTVKDMQGNNNNMEGRFGGISSPIIAGYFLDNGISPLTLYGNYLFIFIVAAIGIIVLTKLYYGKNTSQHIVQSAQSN